MKNREKDSTPREDLAALVERARTGDQEAYTALYETTSQEIYRSIRAMVRDEEQTLDIQQDAYVFAFTHLDQLKEPGKFRSWLRTIAVNRTRSVLRKQSPVLFTELENEEGEGIPELPDLREENVPEAVLERKETARLVQDILEELSPGQRLLVGMYYYEQIPVGEIAQNLGISSGTVKTQLSRSRRKIEAAVKRLEARGVKLYGLSPLPFLLALLKRQSPTAEASGAVLQASLAKTGGVAVHVGRHFFQTALGRVALGVLAAGVLGGGAVGYRWAREQVRIGDYQFPSNVESAENLVPGPTNHIFVDTPEELPTEISDVPETTAPESTEAESTEPETTEPESSASRETEKPWTPEPQPTPAPSSQEAPEPVETEAPAPEPTEDLGMLPTVPPYPPSPGTVTIALGESWSYTHSGGSEASLSFYVEQSKNQSWDSYGWDARHIGNQTEGDTALYFRPEEAGTYTIYYKSFGTGIPVPWATLIVTGGNEE